MPKPKSRNSSQGTPKKSSSRSKTKMKPDKNNNNPSGSKESSSKKSKDYEKYSLRPRSIQNRIETEKRQKGELKNEPKPKSKPPPLSKYRRKTANARERSRMREINTAYEILQNQVPQYPVLPTNAQGKTCEKLTKITTLRLAMNYIQTLKTLLKQPSSSSESSSSSLSSSSSTTSSLLSAAGLSSFIDIESDTDSIGNSLPSSASSISSSCGVSSVASSNCSGSSGSEFSPASSYAMSPMSSCSPVGPDCIQTVMRSVVSPAAAAAISANAANLNNLNLNNVSLSSLTSSPGSLGIVAPHQSITTIVTIPSHPHAQAQYSRQLPPTVHHHHHQQQVPMPTPNPTPSLQQPQLHHQLHTFPPPPPLRPPVTTSSSSSVTYMTPPATAILLQPSHPHPHQLQHLSSQQQIFQQLKPLSSQQQQIHITTLPISSSSLSSQNPLLCSPQATIVNPSSSASVTSAHNHQNQHHLHKTKLPPIATTLSSALLRKSMSSFLTDCIQLTNGVNVSMNNIISCNNNGTRTGSLSSLTESDLSEYTNDLLSDEGSVLDEPMFEDIIGVGATDLDLFLGTDSENLGFTADLSAI